MSKSPENDIRLEVNSPAISPIRGSVVDTDAEPPIFLRAYRALKPVRDFVYYHLSIISDRIIFIEYQKIIERDLKTDVRPSTLLRARNKYWLKNVESRIISLSGVNKITGDPLRVTYFGDKSSLRYLCYKFFPENSVTQVEEGRCLTGNIHNIASFYSRESDLIIFDRPIGSRWVPDYGEWACSPRWVRMIRWFPPNTTKEDAKKSFWKYQHTNYYRSQELGLTRIVSRKVSDLVFFYDSMYLPSMRNRHNSYAVIEDKEYFVKKGKTGFLILLCRSDGLPVAGSLNFSKGNILYSDMNGVLMGDSQLLRNGALAAIYFNTIDYAIENHYAYLDMGLTTPILSDGVFKHKLRWGFEPIRCPWHVMEWLWWNPQSSKSGLDILSAHQFHKEFVTYGGRWLTRLYSDS